MNRLLTTLLLTLAITAAAVSAASAADRCRPRTNEHALARSTQAVVLERIVKQSQHFPLQTIIGCSRRSGHRRTIDTLHRRTADDPTKLVGLRLAGTRVAYVMADGPTIIAEDAIHGGRRHDVGANPSPMDPTRLELPLSWAVDAQGDVAWITGADPTAPPAAQRPTLGIWRAGLGRRGVDSHAYLDGLTLDDGKLGWRRNGTPHNVDLNAVAPSRCGPQKALTGTLDVDFAQISNDRNATVPTACLRSTGKTVPINNDEAWDLLDSNGPYVLVGWHHVSWEGVVVVDLLRGTATDADPFSLHPTDDTVGQQAVITDDGSIAWLRKSGMWVRDAGGTRKVADAGAGTGLLYRDGSTVTWSGGGPTVTLNP
jgi:hypothetical protein